MNEQTKRRRAGDTIQKPRRRPKLPPPSRRAAGRAAYNRKHAIAKSLIVPRGRGNIHGNHLGDAVLQYCKNGRILTNDEVDIGDKEGLARAFDLRSDAYSTDDDNACPVSAKEDGQTKGEIDSTDLIRLLAHLGFDGSLHTFLDVGSGFGNLPGVITTAFKCYSIGFEVQEALAAWSKRMLWNTLGDELKRKCDIYHLSASLKCHDLGRIYKRSDFIVWNSIVWTWYAAMQALEILEKKMKSGATLIASRDLRHMFNKPDKFTYLGVYNLKSDWSSKPCSFYVFRKF